MAAYFQVIAVPDLDNPVNYVMPKIRLLGHNGPEIPHVTPLCYGTAVEHARITKKKKSLFVQYTVKKIPERISHFHKIKNGMCLIKEEEHRKPRSLIISCNIQDSENENTGYYAIYSSHPKHLQTIVDEVTNIVNSNTTLYTPTLAKQGDSHYERMHRVTKAVLTTELYRYV